MPKGVLITSNLTFYSGDRRHVTVGGNINISARQFLHIMSELSALFISKTCLQVLRIIGDSFPLPAQLGVAVAAISMACSSQLSTPQHGNAQGQYQFYSYQPGNAPCDQYFIIYRVF